MHSEQSLRDQVALATGRPQDGAPVLQLKGDASNRSYLRVGRWPDSHVVMVMPPGPPRSEEASKGGPPDELPFLNVQRYLDGLGVRVPRILRYDTAAAMMVLEDLGDLTFERALAGGSREIALRPGGGPPRPDARRRGGETRPGLPRLHPRLRRGALHLGAPPLPRVRPGGVEREDPHRGGARAARAGLRRDRGAAGRGTARLHPPRLPEPEPHGDRRRAGGHRLPGRSPGPVAVRPGRASPRQLRRARAGARRRDDRPLAAGVRARRGPAPRSGARSAGSSTCSPCSGS